MSPRVPLLTRRSALFALGALCGCDPRGCQRSPDRPKADTSKVVGTSVLSFDRRPGSAQRVVVLTPRWASMEQRLPLLIALHGRGEANRGLDVGAWAWTKDYWLDLAVARLREGHLTREHFMGFVDNARLDRFNASLKEHPFLGLVVACPHTPDILATSNLDAAAEFAAFLTQTLIPRLHREFPVIAEAKATGIDGVSLGGRMALLAGTDAPGSFGSIGTLQAAIRPEEVEDVADRCRKLLSRSRVPLRILTSSEDPFRPVLAALAEQVDGSTCEVVEGPHDYVFNRGPGALEMLMWHDRILRRMPWDVGF